MYDLIVLCDKHCNPIAVIQLDSNMTVTENAATLRIPQ